MNKDLARRLQAFARFWTLRGGTRGLVRSAYVWTAVATTIVTAHLWLHDQWWDLPLQILPNLVGFSLGGYAIMLGFGDDRFKQALIRAKKTEANESSSAYVAASARFLWFIIVQVAALLAAVVAKALWFRPSGLLSQVVLSIPGPVTFVTVVGWCLGFFLFIYAITLGGAAALSVYRLSQWFEKHVEEEARRLISCRHCRMDIQSDAATCPFCRGAAK